jgi:D-serine deaminase-like pyridoxal phosphate-dependent protein
MLPVPVSVDIRLERERACMSTRSETNANPVLLATALTQRRTRSCAAMRADPATKRCTPGGDAKAQVVGSAAAVVSGQECQSALCQAAPFLGRDAMRK